MNRCYVSVCMFCSCKNCSSFSVHISILYLRVALVVCAIVYLYVYIGACATKDLYILCLVFMCASLVYNAPPAPLKRVGYKRTFWL